MPLPSLLAAALPLDGPAEAGAVVAVGLACRVAGLLAVCGRWLTPGLTPQLRLGLLVVLAVAAAPTAVLAVQHAGGDLPPLPLLLGSELLLGAGLGLAVAVIVSAVSTAGGVLASAAGLDWAAAFTPGGGDGPGVARLCGWLGLAAFVAAGGQRLVIGGLLESCWRLRVGGAATALGRGELPLADLLISLPAVALSLAMTLALPVLVAVVTTHLATAVCLRTVSWGPSPGLLQGIAGLVLLGGLLAGSRQWADQAGRLLLPPLQTACDGVMLSSNFPAPPPSAAAGAEKTAVALDRRSALIAAAVEISSRRPQPRSPAAAVSPGKNEELSP